MRKESTSSMMQPTTIRIEDETGRVRPQTRMETARRKLLPIKERVDQLFQDYPPSKNPRKFIFGIINEISNFCTLVIIFATASLSIPTIVIGAYFFADSYCPVDKKLSPLLIVGGSIALVHGVVGLILKYFALVNFEKDAEQEKDVHTQESKGSGCLQWLLEFTLVVWLYFALRNVYEISFVVNDDSSDSENYCHPFLYLYASCIVVAGFVIMLGFMLICGVKTVVLLCSACTYCCWKE